MEPAGGTHALTAGLGEDSARQLNVRAGSWDRADRGAVSACAGARVGWRMRQVPFSRRGVEFLVEESLLTDRGEAHEKGGADHWLDGIAALRRRFGAGRG